MIKYIDHNKMGRGIHDWLNSHFHFSFAEYYNENNIQFGVLRVVNDDMVKPGKGFDTHPHKNMEIISYVVDGKLTHKDSMGNESTLSKGQVQYMSAGTGVLHSEYNNSNDPLRFLQIWILPDKNGYDPNYGDYKFNWEDRKNIWLHIVSGSLNDGVPIHIHQDVNVYATEIDKEISFKVESGRQAYLVLINGEIDIENYNLKTRDAMEIIEQHIIVKPKETSHILILEMKKA